MTRFLPFAPRQPVSAERNAAGWIALAAVLAFVALAAPFFAWRVYVADDLGEFHLPLRAFYAEQLRQGESFDWMPSLYGGFYVSGEGQLGAYHPWHLLLYRWLPLGAAFDIELLASYPLLFCGMYLLLMRLVARRDAALLGALAFAFGGFNLLHFVHPNAIGIVAHLPWLLVAIDVSLTTASSRHRVLADGAVALLLASQLLLGYPQYVWFSLLAVAALVTFRTVRGDATFRKLGSLVVAAICGVLIGAMQLLPTWHVLSESVRQVSDAEFANTGSLRPLNILQLVAPYLWQHRGVGQNTHELGLYIGAVPLVLCVWLLARSEHWGEFRPYIRALLLFVAVTFVLALGEYGGLYRLQSLVPLANRFRFPCRAIVLVQLGMAALAAISAAILFARTELAQKQAVLREHGKLTALTATFVLSLAVAMAGPLLWPGNVASLPLIWLGPLLVGVAALLVALVEYRVRGAVALLALFMAADLASYGLSYSVYGRTAELSDYVAKSDVPPGDTRVRVVIPEHSGLRSGDRVLLAGVSRVDGYAGLEPARQLDYADPHTWQLSGVNWAWQPSASNEANDHRWVRVSPTAPRARLVTRVHAANDQPTERGLNTVRVEPALAVPQSSPGECRVLEDHPGRITIETDASARQLLVTTESFDSGWTVLIDGQPGAIVRVDGDFLGAPVAAGKHLVCFEFRPRSRFLGVVVASCGLGFLIALSSIRWIRNV